MNTRTPETEAVGLTRRYGEATVLDVENLHVSQGEAVALLGPNGAGKTTMVNILSTLIQPTAGTGRVLGHDVAHEAGAVRRLIGVTGPIVRPETGQTRRDSDPPHSGSPGVRWPESCSGDSPRPGECRR